MTFRPRAGMVPAHFLCVALSAFVVFPLAAQDTTTLTPPDGQHEDGFGRWVTIDGDVAIASSHGADFDPIATYEGAGAAYFFRHTGSEWVFEEKVRDADSERGGAFGYPVAISGNVALIGKPVDDENAPALGAAYIFRFDGTNWVHEQKLQPDDAGLGDSFGGGLAIDGNVAVVTSGTSTNTGAAYVYRFDGSTWVQEQKLVGASAGADIRMGSAVDVDGNVIVVGSVTYNVSAQLPGAAWVFRYDGSSWSEEELPVATSQANAFFGASVAVVDDVIAVGAVSADGGIGAGQLGTGAVYMYGFDGTSWIHTQKLYDPVIFTGDAFGYSLSLDGNVLASGAINSSSRTGRVHVFVREAGTWMLHASFRPDDAMINDFIGRGVSVSGSRIAIADEFAQRSPQVADVGRFHIYQLADGVSTEDVRFPGRDQPAITSLYPNPFTDRVVLEVDIGSLRGEKRIDVYDMLGRHVSSRAISQQVIWEAAAFPAGVYVFRIQGSAHTIVGLLH